MNDLGFVLLTADRELACANHSARAALGCSGPNELEQRWGEVRQLWDESLRELGSDPNDSAHLDRQIASGGQPRHLCLGLYRLDSQNAERFVVIVRELGTTGPLETDLLHTSQLRGLAHFFSTMAHDVKGPLNTMAINVELLSQSLERPDPDIERTRERQHRYVTALRQEIPRLNRSLETFIEHVRPAADVRERFDLRDLVERVQSIAGPKARLQRINVRVELPDEPLWCSGYAGRLNQALVNITVNALEAMPRGGELTLALRREDGRAALAIADTGPGIPDPLLGRIGTLHFTTKESSTGVGLFTARSVVESHGGMMTVQTAVGQGACFQITLPLASEDT